jgi:hypothetical protein
MGRVVENDQPFPGDTIRIDQKIYRVIEVHAPTNDFGSFTVFLFSMEDQDTLSWQFQYHPGKPFTNNLGKDVEIIRSPLIDLWSGMSRCAGCENRGCFECGILGRDHRIDPQCLPDSLPSINLSVPGGLEKKYIHCLSIKNLEREHLELPDEEYDRYISSIILKNFVVVKRNDKVTILVGKEAFEYLRLIEYKKRLSRE